MSSCYTCINVYKKLTRKYYLVRKCAVKRGWRYEEGTQNPSSLCLHNNIR